MTMRPSHEVLGVTSDATEHEIQAAYRRACMRTHPDRGGSVEEFNEVQKAFNHMKRLMRTPCPLCAGKGYVTTRRGAFVDKSDCPRCWRKT